MRIGLHTSRSGSLENAALKAAELGANTFQIFSTPQTWRAGTPKFDDIRRFEAARVRHCLSPLVVHANYLFHLAAGDGVYSST